MQLIISGDNVINGDRFLHYFFVVKNGKMELLYIEGDNDLRCQLEDLEKSVHYSIRVKN
jgi:hypothetical protein